MTFVVSLGASTPAGEILQVIGALGRYQLRAGKDRSRLEVPTGQVSVVVKFQPNCRAWPASIITVLG